MKNAQYWIEKLSLQQHPEGGFYAETYRSKDRLHESKLPDRYKSPRVFGTSIYFLLTTESVSNFHRLNSDEIWHFHTGDFILVGCTVAPGFEFEDFELADRTDLSSAYPQHQTLIGSFTNN
jgi:predicted cupin superfamily sugar epimerase